MVSGAVELIIRHQSAFDEMHMDIVAVCSGDRRRKLCFCSGRDDTNLVSQRLLDLRSALAGVRNFEPTDALLVDLFPVLAALPNLVRLTLIIKARAAREFWWDMPSHLSRIPNHCPGLLWIVISVVGDRQHSPPDSQDASALLAQLESIAHVDLPDILVKGFSSCTCAACRNPHSTAFPLPLRNERRAGARSRTMRDFDDSRLRARVTRDYESVVRDITRAEEMKSFVDAVMITAVGTVRELLSEVNQQSFMGRIPSEVLAACFAYLPWESLIRASHVCQSWRAAALSAPPLWSHIAPWSHCTPWLLRMALSRAGARPLDLKVDICAPITPEDLYAAIAPYSRQIRYLAWHCDQPTSPWEFPAPVMEAFCSSSTQTLTESFLGGCAGRLRCLYLQRVHLPDSCPAISTVTDLNVVLTPFNEDESPSNLCRLWDLFPHLEWLQILAITRPYSHMLPSGRAPASLRELSLECMSTDYDLMPHYLAWDNGNLNHVSLRQYADTRPDLARMARGAVKPAVKHASDKSRTRVMFEHPAGVTRSINISGIGIGNTAALLEAVQPNFSTVRSAMVSHVALEPLAGVLAALPEIEQLVVHIVPKTADEPTYPNPDPHAFVWTPLAFLADLARTMRRLRAIPLHVWCGGCRRPTFADADDARALIAQLCSLPRDLPPIEIQGFPAEEVSSVDLTGLNVRFDVAATVGELTLHERKEGYYPF
ncbi:hypothetical protein AURDEDRAFT_171224 [Auricularia subglabra TFB-10046 SS5]|uniref:F-box domain-containing protein n=1 Tax=Auricularia subglabra (strain TFB-10046 / SS5) TaxID=717982 RepID=J0DCE0_AURST|nr:hypothetical protein AURDEDRAFT_171224 [Auricularia subglabra TFB-10046 SS5]